MAFLDRNLLLILIAVAALLFVCGIIAAVHRLYKMLRKETRWSGLQNPYGWPIELLGDIDANIVDKSICKKRLRPSRIERNTKKFHEALADVIPEPEAPPVPVRVDSLTKQERIEMRNRITQPERTSSTRSTVSRSSSGGLCRKDETKSEKKRGSGYRERRKNSSRSPETTAESSTRPKTRTNNDQVVIVLCDDNEPPPPYSEVNGRDDPI